MAAVDRAVRSLCALGGASTSRVLNLSAIARQNSENPEHTEAPIFRSPTINAAILLKHRLRSDESYLFPHTRASATKIIVPFDATDLRAGGRSFFIGQKGFQDKLKEAGLYAGNDIEQDMTVLRIVDKLPSLDPFLLRESLRGNEIACADCYFQINPADQKRMFDYVSSQIQLLISLATGDTGGTNSPTARLVSALLSNQVDEKLEPLRLTLGLQPGDFREGVFSWRGFLYYKWTVDHVWPDTMKALHALKKVQPIGPADAELRAFLTSARQTIIENVKEASTAIRKTLAIYDSAYDDLVRNHSPKTFREFLLSAPYLFLDLGEKAGALSHITSFWRYRFPDENNCRVDAEELSSIFHDFISTFPANTNTR